MVIALGFVMCSGCVAHVRLRSPVLRPTLAMTLPRKVSCSKLLEICLKNKNRRLLIFNGLVHMMIDGASLPASRRELSLASLLKRPLQLACASRLTMFP